MIGWRGALHDGIGIQRWVPLWTPFSFVVISIAAWMNQHQQYFEYLVEENRVPREQIGHRRMILPTISAQLQ
jgi:hypothetical protein